MIRVAMMNTGALFESKRTGISLINPQNNPYRRNEFEHEAHMKDDVG